MILGLIITLSLTVLGALPGLEAGQDKDQLLVKAQAAFQAGDYFTAVEAFEAVIRIDPRSVEALNSLARLYATAADPDFFDGKLAVELALMAHDDAPDDTEIIDTLVLGYFVQNKFERAIKECFRASALNPQDPHFYRQVKKIAITWQARLDMNAPRRETLQHSSAAYYLGYAQYHLGEVEEATVALEKALSLGGAEAELFILLARCYIAMGDPEKAVDLIQNQEEGFIQNAPLLIVLGDAFRVDDNPETASACYEMAYALDPEAQGLRLCLGTQYLKMNKAVKAVLILKEAIDRLDRAEYLAHEAESQILYYLGIALADAGEVEEGLNRILESLRLRPGQQSSEDALRALFIRLYGSDKGFRQSFASRETSGGLYFLERAREAGISGGGRPSFADYDGDGDPDLLLGGTRLFENMGRGKFTEVTERSGLADLKGKSGIFGDYDNDGNLDLFVVGEGPEAVHRLYRNKGRKGFEVAATLGENRPEERLLNGAAFGDLNGDGFLDLYLAMGNPHGTDVKSCGDLLYLADGAGGFKEAGAEAGIQDIPPLDTRGVVMGDFDEDGDLDLFLTHAGLAANRLWQNNGRGGLTEVGFSHGLAGNGDRGRFGNSRGAALGDLDGDGDLDFFVANSVEPQERLYADLCLLYQNAGRSDFRFQPMPASDLPTFDPNADQTLMGDLNNDGWLDLLLTADRAACLARLYLGNGQAGFRDVTWTAGIKAPGALGCAYADIDLDGDLDLLVGGSEQPQLYLNQGNDNHWIAFTLKGKNCNGSAIGARLTIDYGSSSQIREVRGGRGACCQDPMAVHFGLGDYKGKVNLSVQWPDGSNDFITSLKADRFHTIIGKN